MDFALVTITKRKTLEPLQGKRDFRHSLYVWTPESDMSKPSGYFFVSLQQWYQIIRGVIKEVVMRFCRWFQQGVSTARCQISMWHTVPSLKHHGLFPQGLLVIFLDQSQQAVFKSLLHLETRRLVHLKRLISTSHT